MIVDKQVLGGSKRQLRSRLSSKEESQMKWCMVAAMALSLGLGGVARAQDDNLDLDALLGDFDSAPEQVEAAPAADAAPVEPAAADAMTEAAPAEADPFAAEPAAAEADPFAADAAPAEADAFAAPAEADPFAAPAEMEAAPAEAVAGTEDAAPAEDDPFADFASEVPAEEAPVAEESVVEAAPADDMLGDLFGADESIEAAAAAPVEEPAVDALAADVPFEAAAPAEELDSGFESADFTAMGEGGEAEAQPSKEAAEKLPAKEIKKIAKETAQQEELRRQNAEIEAIKASEAGFRSMSDGDYVSAEGSFSSALKNLPDRPQNAAVREQISWGLAEAQYLRARDMVQKNERLADARKLVDSALKVAPTHKGVQALDKRLAKLEAIEAQPKPPARQPATLEKAQNIEQMYDEARQWYMLKDYDRASALFEQILLRDPYHKSAMRYLRKIEADKYKLATYERDARVQGMMTEVRRSWSPPIRAKIEIPEQGPGNGVDSKPASDRLNEKMQKIIIPAVEFRQANINDVVNFLVEASIAADPDKEGVNIILNLGQGGGGGAAPAPAPAATEAAVDEWGFGGDDFGMSSAPVSSGAAGVRDITLNLRRITMLDAIKYITEVAGLKYRRQRRHDHAAGCPRRQHHHPHVSRPAVLHGCHRRAAGGERRRAGRFGIHHHGRPRQHDEVRRQGFLREDRRQVPCWRVHHL